MGFRCSFYHYPKEFLNNKENYTSGHTDINLGDNEHLITYDAFTDAIFELEKHKDYSVIHEDGDTCYFRMNKEQFKHFIKHILQTYTQKTTERIINEDMSNETITQCLKDDDCTNNYNSFNKLNVLQKLIYNQYDYKLKTQFDAYDISVIDELLDESPWKISMGFSTQLAIYNMIFVYKILDWDNEDIVITGF